MTGKITRKVLGRLHRAVVLAIVLSLLLPYVALANTEIYNTLDNTVDNQRETMSVETGSSGTTNFKINVPAGETCGIQSGQQLVVDISSSDTSIATVTSSSTFKDNCDGVIPVTVNGVKASSNEININVQVNVNQTTATGKFEAQTAAFKVSVVAPTRKNTSLSVAAASGTYGGSASLSATLTSGGTGVANKSVSFTLNGASAGTATTDASGVASLSASLSGINAGTYATGVGASFAQDSSYNASSGSNSLTVSKATPSITWSNPADVTYGAALSSTQLNATASVAGSFVYTPAAGTKLNAGLGQNLKADFTPTDTTNYNTATRTVQINVNTAPLLVKADDKSRAYGEANPALTGTLSGVVNGDNITGSYSTTATATSPVGDYPIVPSLNDPDNRLGNYSVTKTNGTLSIGKAAATVELNGDRSRTYNGDAHSLTASTTPEGLDVAITYDGEATAPTNAGSYNVVATITDGNYSGSTSATLAIAKADASISWGTIGSKTYGDAAFNLSATATSGADVSFSRVSGPCSVSGSEVTITGAGDCIVRASAPATNNYKATSDDKTISIAKAELTVTGPSLSRPYGAPNPETGSGIITGYVNDETLATSGVEGSAVLDHAASADATAAAGSEHAISVDVSEMRASNYTFRTVAGKLAITKADTTTDAEDKSATYGQSSVTLEATVNAVSPSTAKVNGGKVNFTVTDSDGNKVGSGATDLDIVDGAASATFSLSGVNAGSYKILAEYTGAGNFKVSSNAGRLKVLSVAKADQTITFAEIEGKTYGDEAFAPGATTSSGLAVSYAVSGNCELIDGKVSITGAGSCTVTASQAGDNNYNPAANVVRSFDIAKAAATVTLGSLSHTYDGTAKTATASASATRPNADNLGDITIAYKQGDTVVENPTNAGDYSVTATLTNDNYQGSATGTLTIAKASSTTEVTVSNGTYNGQAQGGSAVVTGAGGLNQSVEVSYSGHNGTEYGPSATAPTNAGEYTASASYAESTNHLDSSDSKDFSIARKALTITAEDKQMVYGGTKPAFMVSYSGFVGSENKDNLQGTLAFSGAAIEATGAGSYSIVPGGLTSGNYEITFAPGTLTIDKAVLTVAAKDNSRKYGDANPAFGAGSYEIKGFVNGDDASVVTGAPVLSYANSATATATAGSEHDINVDVSEMSASNYSFSFAKGKLTITKAQLTVTPADKSREYGDANGTLTGSIDGIKNNDAISAAYSTTAGASSPVGSYDITATLGDPDVKLVNYDVTLKVGKLTVTPAPLSVTAEDKSRKYGEQNPELTGTLTGVKNGESISKTFSTAATAASAVGEYAITADVTGPSYLLSNYTIKRTNGKLTIGKAVLTVKADDKTKVLGAANPPLTASYSGFVNGDTQSVLSGEPSLSTTATASSPVGSYPISVEQGTLSASNYSFTYTSGTLKIVYASGSCLGAPGRTILQPINVDGTSVFKLGSTVPAKFRVCDANGNSIGTAGVVQDFKLVKTVTGTGTSVNETVESTTPDTAFRWDATNQQWIFNISTKNLTGGNSYNYTIWLNDGTTINFGFGIRK